MPPRTGRACLVQLEPSGVQAKAGELSEAQASRARPSPRPKNTNAGDARRTEPKLGHLGNTGSRRKGPGVGPVLGPRHEELADGVELR